MKRKIILVVSILILLSVYQIVVTEIDKKNAMKMTLKIIDKTYHRKHAQMTFLYKKKKYSVPNNIFKYNGLSIGDDFTVYYLPNRDKMVLNNKSNYLGLCLLIPAALVLVYLLIYK